jgi:hypothetical protein
VTLCASTKLLVSQPEHSNVSPRLTLCRRVKHSFSVQISDLYTPLNDFRSEPVALLPTSSARSHMHAACFIKHHARVKANVTARLTCHFTAEQLLTLQNVQCAHWSWKSCIPLTGTGKHWDMRCELCPKDNPKAQSFEFQDHKILKNNKRKTASSKFAGRFEFQDHKILKNNKRKTVSSKFAGCFNVPTPSLTPFYLHPQDSSPAKNKKRRNAGSKFALCLDFQMFRHCELFSHLPHCLHHAWAHSSDNDSENEEGKNKPATTMKKKRIEGK